MDASGCASCGAPPEAVEWVHEAAANVCLRCGAVSADAGELDGLFDMCDGLVALQEPWTSAGAFQLRRHDGASRSGDREYASKVRRTWNARLTDSGTLQH